MRQNGWLSFRLRVLQQLRPLMYVRTSIRRNVPWQDCVDTVFILYFFFPLISLSDSPVVASPPTGGKPPAKEIQATSPAAQPSPVTPTHGEKTRAFTNQELAQLQTFMQEAISDALRTLGLAPLEQQIKLKS